MTCVAYSSDARLTSFPFLPGLRDSSMKGKSRDGLMYVDFSVVSDQEFQETGSSVRAGVLSVLLSSIRLRLRTMPIQSCNSGSVRRMNE